MPYPNEHAARQASPSGFKTFRRTHPKGWAAGVSAIFGITSDGKSTLQSIRFERARFTEAQARAWLKTNGFSAAGFEPASGKPAKSRQPPALEPSAGDARFDLDGVASTEDGKPVKLRFRVFKVDQYEQKMFGWLYICRGIDGQQVVDHSGEVISIKTLEAASYKYVHEHRKMGDMHQRTDAGAVVETGYLIECVCYTPDKRAAMAKSLGLPLDAFEGKIPDAMWVGYQITDPETWADVVSGRKPALSLGGRARRVPAAQGAY